jgi:hypothetical protein
MLKPAPRNPESQAQAAMSYEAVDERKLQRLRVRHAWIVEPIQRASDTVQELPFFSWLRSIQSPLDFKPAAVQLYHHSATFPKVMGLMLGLTPMAENFMMPFYAKHAYGEADHHELLMKWMLREGILASPREIAEVITTIETNACVNLAYQMAMEQDRAKWLVCLNSGIERCSNDLVLRRARGSRRTSQHHGARTPRAARPYEPARQAADRKGAGRH